MCKIFVVEDNHENFSTTKISRYTVCIDDNIGRAMQTYDGTLPNNKTNIITYVIVEMEKGETVLDRKQY